jgi:hypothetical protein
MDSYWGHPAETPDKGRRSTKREYTTMNEIESIIEEWKAKYSGYMPAKDQEVVKWLEEVCTRIQANTDAGYEWGWDDATNGRDHK